MKAPLKSLWSEFKAFAFKGNMIDLAVAVVIGAAFSGVINSLVSDIIMPAVSYVVTGVSQTTHAVKQAASTATEKAGLAAKPAETQPSTEPATQPATAPAGVAPAGAALAGVPPAAPVAATQAANPIINADGSITYPAIVPTTQPAGAIVVLLKQPPAAAPAAKEEKLPEKAVEFDLKVGRFKVGSFVGSLINFIIIAFAVFIIIVKLLGSAMKRVAGGTPKPEEKTTKECPECLSMIPIRAKRCAYCTAVQPPSP